MARRRHAARQARRAGRHASAASSSTSTGDARVSALKAQARLQCRLPVSRRISSPRRSRASSTRTARTTRAALRRHRRQRRRDPVLPLSRTRACSARSRATCRRSTATSASEASLRRDYVLSQDAYGSGTQRLAAHQRLSRCRASPSAVSSRRRPRSPGSSTPTSPTARSSPPVRRSSPGYDFLADAANAVTARARSRDGVAPSDTLITPNGMSPQDSASASWTRREPRHASFFGSRHDVDLPRRALQRQQRARRRLHDEPDHDRPRRVDDGLHELDRVQRRLPLRLQHRRHRRDRGRDARRSTGRRRSRRRRRR